MTDERGVPQVVNLREINLQDPDVARIDRLSKWGNPYVVGVDGTRPGGDRGLPGVDLR